jgi:hypothetical protein
MLLKEHFAGLKGWQDGDLLAQRDVKPVFRMLSAAGWTLRDEAEFVRLVPPDSDWLVQTLRSPRGTAFMRKVAPLGTGYERLDRLSQLPGGRRQIESLISARDGHLLLEFLETTELGRKTTAAVARTPSGRSFDDSTGRLYTARAFEEELLKRHATELERRSTSQTLPRSVSTPAGSGLRRSRTVAPPPATERPEEQGDGDQIER